MSYKQGNLTKPKAKTYRTHDSSHRHQLVNLWTAYGILQAAVIIALVARRGGAVVLLSAVPAFVNVLTYVDTPCFWLITNA